MVALAGCSSEQPAASPDPVDRIAIDVDMDSCGPAWSAPDGGRVRFSVTNHHRMGTDVFLTDARTNAYLLEFEAIGSGASLDGSAVLGNGYYRLLCMPEDAEQVAGPTVEVTGSDATGTTPAYAPLGNPDLIPATQEYQRWVVAQLPRFRREAAGIVRAVAAGATPEAKAAWLEAHLTYETLGAAYDAFGDVNDEINGNPRPGLTPLNDPDLAGFRKLEALLWSGAPAEELKPVADALVASVDELSTTVRQMRIEPNDMGLRAHEIVENAIQFELTGATDAGSHTNLATVVANLAGSAHALAPLRPLLRPRYPQLAETEAALAASRHLVDSFRRSGSWRPLDALTATERTAVNASLQRTVELLANVSAITDVRLIPEVAPE